MSERKELKHSGLVSFYDADEDLGVSVHEGLVTVDCRGSSELRGMSRERTQLLVTLLRAAMFEIGERGA